MRKLIALILIALITGIPMYSAAAFAALYNTRAYGQDKLSGYARSDDSVTIETIVPISDNSLPAAPSKIKTSSGEQFQQCFNMGGLENMCTYQFTTQGLVKSKPITLVIKEYGIFGEEQSSSSASLIIDYKKPQILSFDAVEQRIGAGQSTFKIKAKDTACDDCSEQQCSGIKKIVLYDKSNEAVSTEKEFDSGSASAQCSADETIKWEPVKDSRKVEICAIAIDRFGQMSDPLCDSFDKDISPPPAESIKFFVNGRETAWVGSSPSIAKMELTIGDGSQIVQDSISAVLTELNQFAAVEVSSAPNLCVAKGESLVCTWERVVLRAKMDLTGNVYLNVKDKIGNEARIPVPFSLKYDKTPPKLIEFGSLHKQVKNGYVTNYLMSENNTFVAVFEESESGFANTNVLADFKALNPAYSASGIQPDECIFDSNSAGSAGWTCLWKALVIKASDKTVSTVALLEARDDAGNAADGMLTSKIVVDNTPPEMTELKVSVGDMTNNPCPVAGDVLTYRIQAKEEFDKLLVVVNASAISEHEGELIADCTPPASMANIAGNTGNAANNATPSDEPDIWKCELGIDKLKSGYINYPVGIMLEDAAGNRAELSIDQEVCESDTTTLNPNLVTFVKPEKLIPEKLDRRLVSKVDAPVFIPLKFVKSNSTFIMGISDDNCKQTEFVSGSYSPFVLNPGSKESYLSLRLKTGKEYNADTILIQCRIYLTIRSGSKVYKNPETEWIELEMPVYNVPVGQIDAAVQAQIAAEIAEINGIKGKIESEKKSNEGFKSICKILEILEMLNSLAQTIRNTMFMIAAADPTFSQDATYQSICKMAVAFNKFMEQAALFLAPLRFMCAMNSCKFCSGEVVGQAVGSFAGDFIKLGKGDDALGGGSSIFSDVLGSVMGSSQSSFDPYANIHDAEACMCSPAKIYNYKKLRQIKCLKVKCLQKTGEVGMPTQVCQQAYDKRVCVYFEGAGSKKGGSNFDGFLGGMLKGILANILGKYLEKMILAAVCNPTEFISGGETGTNMAAILVPNSPLMQIYPGEKSSKGMEGITGRVALDIPEIRAELTATNWFSPTEPPLIDTAADKGSKAAETAAETADDCLPPKTGAESKNVLCALLKSGSLFTEIKSLTKGLDTDKSKDDPKLEGPDYCSGIEGVEAAE